MSKKSTNKIPKGLYCYDENGVCPYWSLSKNGGYQNNGYCSYLKYGDYEPDGCFSLLWDQCKECGINMNDMEYLQSEINEINDLLKNLPTEQVLTRIGLEHRKEQLLAELKELEDDT